jgi:hypothetical protein
VNRGTRKSRRQGSPTRLGPEQQESTMKKFVLAAFAALSLGIGSANAAQTVINHQGQTIWGPAYSDDAAGG